METHRQEYKFYHRRAANKPNGKYHAEPGRKAINRFENNPSVLTYVPGRFIESFTDAEYFLT